MHCSSDKKLRRLAAGSWLTTLVRKTPKSQRRTMKETFSDVFFSFPEDVQKGDDVKISRQFKESVIQPILKVRHSMNPFTLETVLQVTLSHLSPPRLISGGTSFWAESTKLYTSCRSVTPSCCSSSARSSASGPRRFDDCPLEFKGH